MKYSLVKIVLFSSLFLFIMTSCRKESTVSDFVNPNSRVCTTYASQFEAVWQGMDQGYVFWGHDTVNWDERYRTFKPVFDSFDHASYVSQAAYQQAYTDLFEGLLDHHLFGIFYAPGNNGKFAMVSPGVNEYEHTTYSGAEMEKELDALQKRSDLVKYIGYDATINYTYGISIPGTHFALIKGKNAGEMIAYFRFTGFSLSELLQYRYVLPSYVFAPIKAFYGTDEGYGITPKGYANNDSVVGIIIDLRGNGGGSTADLQPFIGSLAQQHSVVGYTRVKDGFGRLDYSPWAEYMVYCPSNHLLKEKPVVALVDINSVSCAELATMLIKGLPQGKVIGERTYGAIGALLPNSTYSHDLFYSGCMGDYTMYEYYRQYIGEGVDYLVQHVYRSEYKGKYPFYIYTSTFNMVDKDYNQVEGVGVKPDIEVLFNRNRLWNEGLDIQLERALRYIKTGR